MTTTRDDDLTDELEPRQFRALKSEWLPFEAATKVIHPKGRSPRAKVLREFMNWYMRRPGAKLPERPPAGPWSKPTPTDADPGRAAGMGELEATAEAETPAEE